jgi:hypothetical protein
MMSYVAQEAIDRKIPIIHDIMNLSASLCHMEDET